MDELKDFLNNNLNNPEAVREQYLTNPAYYEALIRQNKSKLRLLKFMYPKHYRVLKLSGILS